MATPSFENNRRSVQPEHVSAMIARQNIMSEPSQDCYVEEVRGDFMSPYLNFGDLVIVDPKDDRLHDGLAVFEFVPGVPEVRRVQIMPGQVRIFGDNPNYEAQCVSIDRARLALMGRVRGFMKKCG